MDAAQLFADPRAFGTALAALLSGRFGVEWLDWEPETVALEIRDEFGIAEVPEENFDKIFAVATLIKTDQFYQSVPAFHHIITALNGDASFDTYDPPDPEDIAWGLYESLLHDPPSRDEEVEARFSPNVQAYVGAVLKASGMTRFSGILRGFGDNPAEVTFADDPVLFEGLHIKEQADDLAVTEMLRSQQQELALQIRAVREYLSKFPDLQPQ